MLRFVNMPHAECRGKPASTVFSYTRPYWQQYNRYNRAQRRFRCRNLCDARRTSRTAKRCGDDIRLA